MKQKARRNEIKFARELESWQEVRGTVKKRRRKKKKQAENSENSDCA